MHPDVTQLVSPVLAIVLLILLITRLRFHPFLALILSAGFLGIVSGVSPVDTVKSFQKGFGSILASVGLVVGLGSMLGGLLLESGGADKVANAFVGLGSKRWIPTTICAAALLIGLPHLFDVSFVMLVPLAFVIARRTNSYILRIGVPLAAGLYVSHGLLPPHPSPTLAMAAYHADAGKTIFYGFLIAIPMAIISGPLFTSFIMRWFPASGGFVEDAAAAAPAAPASDRKQPSLALVLISVLLPPGLMMLRTFGRNMVDSHGALYAWLEFVGDPIVSLLIAVLFALYALGIRSGFTLTQIQKILGKSLAPAAGVILILGAGGGLKEMLVATHVSDQIAHWAMNWQINPLILGWLIAALIRVAIGSATVATVTAAGIVAPLAAADPHVNLELLVLATSSGGLMLSHLNDSGFWLFKEYFKLSVSETLKSWTLLVSLQSLIGLAGVLILDALIH
ncbi:gluconate:H+ symporter [Herbaspirillum sp. alder98]|uniref:GntT/GntP/DsdX family permease n=1 Tax=Herbaspirillum sp. alder98 TaxID=2913096 RepID=UPI001CD8930D|nr:gluconate:H+ symporter [Herbaspirillum sp. alder98]MCA1326376.1 GntP family permease [Herbaspirillum sp. alder98]